jgi:hypothetical protein
MEDNIKMDTRKRNRRSVDWVTLAQDTNRWQALVSTAKNLRVP